MSMKTVYIDLQSGRMVKQFVQTISTLEGSFELISDRTTLNAKSIMGIYCLDLMKPLLLKIECDTDKNLELLSKFIINNDSVSY